MNTKLIQIQQAKNSNAFKKYISYIRFPKYKNFVANTNIEFPYPITALVGQNGSGKSSVLKALYACIEGNSLGDYWFSTKVDTIQDLKQSRNCFIYNYISAPIDQQYEVLSQRAPRKGEPDYWETSKPVAKYGMIRNPQDADYRKSKLQSKCVYIDFHSVLSAFDKYRFFLSQNTIKRTNSYLRKKSGVLSRVINEDIVYTYNGYVQNKKPELLTSGQLSIISTILGKKYINGKIINHKIFSSWGTSVYLETTNYKYSDAFAGSGETAVTILVKKLTESENGSLILLDEPEVCLHPGAQKKLFDFICDICLKKQLQVIISTHSPFFIKDLPENAIKVFIELIDGKIEVTNENNSGSAFYFLGADNENKKIIYVEDSLGKTIVEELASNISESILDQIEVIVHPGGAESIKRSIAISSQLGEKNKFFILDGDKKKVYQDYKTLSLGENLKNKFEEIIQDATDMTISKLFAANSNEDEQIKVDRYKDFLEYWTNNVSFFPKNIPEEFIWDDDVLKKILDDETLANSIISNLDYKTRFVKTSEALTNTSRAEDIFHTQRIFLIRWLKEKNTDFEYIKSRIMEIVS